MSSLTPEERVLLIGARAVIDRLLGEEAGPEAEQGPPEEEPTFMRIQEFCRSRSISRRSLDAYIAKGLPVRRHGARMIRVPVAEADAWLEKQGA